MMWCVVCNLYANFWDALGRVVSYNADSCIAYCFAVACVMQNKQVSQSAFCVGIHFACCNFVPLNNLPVWNIQLGLIGRILNLSHEWKITLHCFLRLKRYHSSSRRNVWAILAQWQNGKSICKYPAYSQHVGPQHGDGGGTKKTSPQFEILTCNDTTRKWLCMSIHGQTLPWSHNC